MALSRGLTLLSCHLLPAAPRRGWLVSEPVVPHHTSLTQRQKTAVTGDSITLRAGLIHHSYSFWLSRVTPDPSTEHLLTMNSLSEPGVLPPGAREEVSSAARLGGWPWLPRPAPVHLPHLLHLKVLERRCAQGSPSPLHLSGALHSEVRPHLGTFSSDPVERSRDCVWTGHACAQ